MTTQSPITPTPELVEQWMQDHATKYDLARHAAQWGADTELEACLNWLTDRERFPVGHEAIEDLKADRRPKPPSLKEQALAALNEIEDRHAGPTIQEELIRRALETLPE
jgi:hypothetical protein